MAEQTETPAELWARLKVSGNRDFSAKQSTLRYTVLFYKYSSFSQNNSTKNVSDRKMTRPFMGEI
ncbi:hypothetical protein J2D73_13165 [Acetobacter sacchari]|uniref:Uncharacterized protein n=1 Tax=Acetobacter sacchari TaxID=2661687 RepID=A0ABS3LXW3_9PROT|nr:hypothetical protein [Acetobacter sacchari]MBO1360738.1 hypothetical protein [Acetobacter sacchari]